MRILFFAPRFHTNQVPAVKGLQAAGHEVRYLVLQKGRSEDYSVLSPVVAGMTPLWRLLQWVRKSWRDPMKQMKFGIPSPFCLWRELAEFRPDCVVFRGDPLRTVPNIVLWGMCLARRIPVVIYTQDPVCGGNHSPGRRLSYWLFLEMLKYPWYSPVLGEAGGTSRRGMTYLPFVQEARTFAAPDLYDLSELRILTIGKLVPRKNHRLLLQALARLKEDFAFHLTLVGECSVTEHEAEFVRVRETVYSLGLVGKVSFRLNLTRDEVDVCYREADLFVLPSTREPASVSNLEAMAHGVPVICSDTNGTCCYTTDGYDGFVFRDNDMESLVGVLRRAMSSPRALKIMGENALATVRHRHSPSAFAASFDALLARGSRNVQA